MANYSEMITDCDEALQANTANLGALYDGVIKHIGELGSLLLDQMVILDNLPTTELLHRFQDNANRLQTLLQESENPHAQQALTGSLSAAATVETLPDHIAHATHKIREAFNAVLGVQENLTHAQTSAFRTTHGLERYLAELGQNTQA